MSSGQAIRCVGACWRARACDVQVNKITLALVHHCLRDALQVSSKEKEQRILKESWPATHVIFTLDLFLFYGCAALNI